MTELPLKIPTLLTARLTLAPIAMSHSAGMFEMWRHAEVQEFSGPAKDNHGAAIHLPARTAADSDRLIQFWLQAARDGWGFRWAMLMAGHGEFVGHLGFNSLLQCSEIAFHMNPQYWGGGLMLEAAQAAIEWRSETGASEIEAFIEPQNTRSAALATRLGMNPTGTMSATAQRYQLFVEDLKTH